MDPLEQLLERLSSRKARIGVVGLGYVGLPLALEAVRAGFPVTGIDINTDRVEQLRRGENYIQDISTEDVRQAIQNHRLEVQSNYEGVENLDVIVLAVPTPLDRHHQPDLTAIRSATQALTPHLRRGQLISLESTTFPGTTEEVMQPLLARSGLKAEQDFFLAHSPERVDPGNKRWNTKNTPKVVGGTGPRATKAALAFYGTIVDHVVPVSSARTAELVKIFENTFRAVNIALVNEMAILCDRMGMDVWEVLNAAFTKPFGIMPFYPGPGVGGHCVPIDPHYLEWKAKEFEAPTRFIQLAGEVNRAMPRFVHEKIWRALNSHGKALSTATVLILGVAYKKDIGDLRESPALALIRLLEKDGATIHYHDPFVATFTLEGKTYTSTPLTSAALRSADIVVIITPHSSVDYRMVIQEAPLVLDTRHVTSTLLTSQDKHVLFL